ncbi:MAG: hypothetical protein IKQ75_00765 [Bacteroidales bacterium]|nr:hypothetical protein [Bacteroidales bacterium]MBR6160380.1 hypothetical protein [Bacteroidales bacterium]
MKKYFPLLLLVAVLLSSCSAIYTYRESTARYVEPIRAGFVTPVAADMRIDQNKITFTQKFENTLSRRAVMQIMSDVNNNRESGLVLSWKKNTMAAALKQYKADDIITPTFEIMPSEDLKYIEVTVTGYPAVYVNYRKATQEDVNMITPFLDDNKNLKTDGVLIIKRQ